MPKENIYNDLYEREKGAARTVLNHTNLAEGTLQIHQAQNELKTLLAYELARQNALDADLAQLQAMNQTAEYDSNVESAYIDSITKFDVIDPYDGVNFQLLKDNFPTTNLNRLVCRISNELNKKNPCSKEIGWGF